MAPRTLNPERDPLSTLVDETAHTLYHLRLSKSAAALLPPWESLLKDVQAGLDKERALLAKLMEALVRAEYTDQELLDVAIRDVVDTLLKLFGQDRGHRVYQHYLRGSAPSELTRPTLGSSVEHVRVWSDSLKAAPEKELQDLAAPMGSAVAEADKATVALTSAHDAVSDFRARARPALYDRVNTARQILGGELLALEKADKTRRLGKDYAERFFRQRSSRTEPADTLELLASQEAAVHVQLQAIKERQIALQSRTEAERLAAEERARNEAAMHEAERRAAEAQAEIARLRKKLGG